LIQKGVLVAKKTAKKKTVAKKVTAKTTVKKTAKKKNGKKSPFSATELKHFKELLLKKRLEIIGDVTHIESESLKKSRLDAAGDLSSMPIHMADQGTDNFEQEFALGLMDGERKILDEVDKALIRVEQGTYGRCTVLAKPIKKARLEALPWAKYSIEYATMIEKGDVIEGEKPFDYEEEPQDTDLEEESEDVANPDKTEDVHELDTDGLHGDEEYQDYSKELGDVSDFDDPEENY
jgi:DnaK suppressor protein